MLAACSDSGTDGAPGTGGSDAGLPGQVVMDGKLVRLSDGAVTTIVPEYGNGDTPLLALNPAGSEYVEMVNMCEFDDFEFLDCLQFRDTDGTATRRYGLSWDLQSRLPRFSVDGQQVAFVDKDNTELVIVTREGVLVVDGRRGVGGFSWVNDGDLVYTADARVLRASAGLLADVSADATIASIPTELGTPIRVSASPDGTRLALVLITESTAATRTGTVWTMNIDGTDLQPFARSPDGIRDRVNDVHWSPDGRWIAVRQPSIVASGGGSSPGNRAGTWTALPSDRDDQVLGTEASGQVALQGVCFDQVRCEGAGALTLPPREMVWVAD